MEENFDTNSTPNSSKIYFLHENNKAILKGDLGYQRLFENEFQDYISFIYFFFSSRYTRLIIARDADVSTKGQINNVLKTLKIINYKIFTILKKYIKLINEIEKMKERDSYLPTHFLIDNDENPIIELIKTSKLKNKGKEYILSQIKQYVQFYQKLINDITNNRKEKDSDFSNFIEDVTTFTTEFLKKFEKNGQLTDLPEKISPNKSETEFSFDNLTTEFYFDVLRSIAKNHYKMSGENIIKIIESIRNFYAKEVSMESFEQIYEDVINNSKQTLDKKRFNQEFFQSLFNCFKKKIKELSKYLPDNSNRRSLIEINPNFHIFSNYKLYIDDDNKFILERNISHDQKGFKREINIFQNKYSKYIVHYNEQNYSFPYFPIGPLQHITIKLSDADKLVIILEIATALKDLHSNNEYHGSLSNRSIFINSDHDAYIGSIFHDESNEKQATKTQGPFYYRPPEKIYDNNQEDRKNEIEREGEREFIQKQQKGDIYSFGILMHEIITETSPNNRMDEDNLTQKKRIEIMKENYKEFLFEGKNNEKFDEKKDHNMNDMKTIIEKCLEIDPTKRLNVGKVIDEIKQTTTYKENKEEIEYRISKSKDSQTYQCTISDIVKSYYEGQEDCFKVIENFVQKYIPICAEKELNTDQYIKMILSAIKNPKDESIESYINDIKQIIEYSPDIIKSDLLQIYPEFFKIIDLESSKLTYKEKIIFLFDNYQRRNKFYLFDDVYQIIIKNLLHQKYFDDKLSKVQINPDEMQEVRELLRFGEMNSAYKLFIDNKFHFYLQKSYIYSNKYENQREERIFSRGYSKFIVHITKPNENNKIVLPYFPMGVINSIFTNSKSKRRIELSTSDKLVIILEIATALKDLHSNNEYHGNLSNRSIFINSDHDAYIGSIFHYESNEKQATKLQGTFYYRPPEKIYDNNQEDKNPESEEFIQKQQKGDIYSFGILMHEIITETSPNNRMDEVEMPREERIETMKKKYKEFLFKGKNNEKFDKTKDHNMNDMKTIIEKCLEIDSTNRLNVGKVIDEIKQTTTYEENKEEIEYRISKSKDSRTYQCTISDVVKSYYEGQEDCYKDITSSLIKYEQLSSTDDKSKLSNQNDIIKKIYETFDIVSSFIFDNDFEDNLYDDFEDIFNKIIKESFNRKICKNNSIFNIDFNDKQKSKTVKNNFINSSDKLFMLLMKKNIEQKPNIEYIIPVSTLRNFIEHNKDKIENLIPTWIYYISAELSLIHSKNFYHGKLSMDSIGIYYNHETQTFIPSIILFYSIYKQNNEQNQQYSYHDPAYSEESINEKYQKKDIKKLLKIIKTLCGININQFKLISNNVIKEIEQANSAYEIACILHDFININSKGEQKEIFEKNDNFSHNDYSSYQITFPVMINMHKLMKNKFSFEESFIEIKSILEHINGFLDIVNNNLDQAIYYINNISQAFVDVKSNPIQDNELDITNMISNIAKKYSKAKQLLQTYKNESDTNYKKTDNKYQNIELYNLSESKLKMNEKKRDALVKKEVFRYVEFSGLTKKSFEFLFSRYINNLNSDFVYRITVKLANYKYLETTDYSITIADIKKIIHRINSNFVEPEPNGSTIYVYVNKFK